MILTCPSCGTQYVVKDGAIPPGGRQVRCASCKHSWHQDSQEPSAPERSPEPDGSPEPEASSQPEIQPAEAAAAGIGSEGAEEHQQEDESLAEATLIEPRSGPEAEERAYEEAAIDSSSATGPESSETAPADAHGIYANAAFDMTKREGPADVAADSDWQEPPQAEAQGDEFAPFPAPDEVEPRRRNPVIAILVVVVIVVVLAAAFWFLAPPEFKARLGLAGVAASPLALVTTHMDRQRLESGNELLTVSGRVINPTGKEQDVPPLNAQLRTKTGKVVYSWTIAPPAHSLPAGASAPFNSAEVNVPPGGDELTITVGSQAS